MTIEFYINCDNCSKTSVDEMEFSIRCIKCEDKLENERLKNAIEEVYSKDYLWEDRENYHGFRDENEKTIYLRGIRYGIECALFWMADYYNEVRFWEELSESKKMEK